MAGTSLLALIDDIATLLDDISVMTKIAAKKTAGVLGDDLALNAEQVAGVTAERELPVVWAVAKGSVRNKLVLVPAALALSAVAPWLVAPLLMIGGAYLCYEGFEKIAHKFLHRPEEDRAEHAAMLEVVADPAIDIVAFEKEKVAGAIRTDFVLSAEIIVIALGTVKEASLPTQIAVVTGIAAIMTVGVYALVAAIVKLDDLGLHLMKSEGQSGGSRAITTLGRMLVSAAPRLMKTLSIVGTAAMFMVGGGILVHGIPGAEGGLHHVEEVAHAVPVAGKLLAAVVPAVVGAVVGVVGGGMVLFFVLLGKAVIGKTAKSI